MYRVIELNKQRKEEKNMETQTITTIKKSQEELDQCRENQSELCEKKGYPEFAPAGGTCYQCGKDVYQNYLIGTQSKISNGYDGTTLVTGCPHCHKSFCD